VPEIQDGTVIIHSIAREAGSRTKIAVYSRDDNVDPIGACIGPKGIRKNSITNEIRGEKIDIIKYSESPEKFIRAALAPATVVSVTETGDRSCKVLVEDDQLSLAIGKEGQNARLAARLTGYSKIDIKSVSSARSAAFNDIIEGRNQAASSFGENLAQALKSAMESEKE
jgi:N utilization substance protein A